MTYCIREQVFTIGDRFHIMDENGAVLFIAESEIFTFGKKLHLYHAAGDDAIGEEAAYIAQEITFFACPRYNICLQSDTISASVVKEFTFFTKEYSVEGPGWQVTGDFFDHEYSIFRDGAHIGDVAKEWFTFGDCYTIHVDDDRDALLVLCTALVIDCMDERKN